MAQQNPPQEPKRQQPEVPQREGKRDDKHDDKRDMDSRQRPARSDGNNDDPSVPFHAPGRYVNDEKGKKTANREQDAPAENDEDDAGSTLDSQNRNNRGAKTAQR